MGQGRKAYARTQVGIQAEMFSQRQQGSAFRLFIGGEMLPFGTAHGAEQNGVRLFAGANGFFGKSLAAVVNARTPYKCRLRHPEPSEPVP